MQNFNNEPIRIFSTIAINYNIRTKENVIFQIISKEIFKSEKLESTYIFKKANHAIN